MAAKDGQVPTPRRPALPRLRRVTPTSSPTGLPFAVPADEAPRVAGLSDLLADLDALRMTLQTDLTLAAAALDAGADDLAGELVDSDLGELHAFASRSADRLARLDAPTEAPTEDLVDAEDVVAVPSPLRRRRILSAAPLMAAAAAVIGFVAVVPDRGVSSPETTMTSAATAGYELSRLAQAGAPDEDLKRAAERLNEELEILIAKAAHDPAAAQQALMLLETTTQVLAEQGDSGVLRSVMAETRALRERLRDALPVVAQRPLRTSRSTVKTLVPVLPKPADQPEKRTSEPKSSPKPSPSAKPSPTPAPASPAPAPESTPEPTPDPADPSWGPLPHPDDNLPGW